MSNFSFRKRWPLNFTRKHKAVYVVCAVYYFLKMAYWKHVKNVYPLIWRINMPTQICHTSKNSEKFLGKRGAWDTFFHHEDTVDMDTHSNNDWNMPKLSRREIEKTREKSSMSQGRSKSIGMWDISNIPVPNHYYSFVNLTTLSSINQNLSKCLCCICKQLIRSSLLHMTCDMQVLLFLPPFYRTILISFIYKFGRFNLPPKNVPSPENNWNL